MQINNSIPMMMTESNMGFFVWWDSWKRSSVVFANIQFYVQDPSVCARVESAGNNIKLIGFMFRHKCFLNTSVQSAKLFSGTWNCSYIVNCVNTTQQFVRIWKRLWYVAEKNGRIETCYSLQFMHHVINFISVIFAASTKVQTVNSDVLQS